jgi:hypothetical protein
MGDGIVFENPGLRLAIGAHVVSEIAAGAQNDLNGSPNPAAEKTSATTSYHAEPAPESRMGARWKAIFRGEPARNFNRTLQGRREWRLVVQNALIDFDAAERDGMSPARQRPQHGL